MRGLSTQSKRTVAQPMAVPARSLCTGFGISLLGLGAWSATATATLDSFDFDTVPMISNA